MKGAKAKGYFKSMTENEIYWTTFLTDGCLITMCLS